LRNKKPIQPPSLADKLLTWHCGNAFMEDLRGDLHEMFEKDVSGRFPFWAKLKYWRQVVSLMNSYAVEKRKQQQAYHAYSYTTFNTAMIKNYFLVTVRSLMKSKLYIAINIFGLAIATSCCIIAYFNYHFNSDFDTNYKNAGEIYRVSSLREFQGKEQLYGIVPMALGNIARQHEFGTRYNFSNVSLRIEDNVFNEDIRYVDPEFFQLFKFDFIQGRAPLKNEKHMMAISDKLAEKLFGTTEAVGKSVSQVLDGDVLKAYEIGGVFREQPMNSSFVDGGYALYENYHEEVPSISENDWKNSTTLFLKINDPTAVRSVWNEMQEHVSTHNKIRDDATIKEFVVEPFQGLAVRDMENDTQNFWTHAAISKSSVNGCAIMAMLVMLIACFNLTNTTLAISSRRVKEIGVRKVMGSFRGQLIFQFLGETAVICVVAVLAGMWLTSVFLLPAFNSLWPYMKLQADYFGNNGILTWMGMILVGTILIAGAYPAFYISKFEPVKILKGTFRFEGMTSLSMVLLMVQFVVSLVGIVCSVAFVQNARYQRSINLGFDEHVIYAKTRTGKEAELFKIELSKNPDITSIATSRHTIGWSVGKTTAESDSKKIQTDLMEVGNQYLKTAGATFIEGRDFINDSETDKSGSAVVSKTFVTAMGWKTGVGNKITLHDSTSVYVVGVVEDIYSRGLWRKLEPMMFRYVDKELCTYVSVRAQAGELPAINEIMDATWKELFPNRVYDGRYLDENVVEAVEVNDNIVKMFGFVGMVAILLSGTGLFTLVSLNVVKRFKEIGIRKVMGASDTRIAALVNARFVIILLISSVLGSWLSMMMIEPLMQGIWAFYQKPGVGTLLLSVGLIFVISAITISTKIVEVARMDPAKSLRSE
jgi:putative ABC transport system permease protein